MTGHDKSLVDQALDLFVYVPLGVALEARDLLPKLAERGRGQVALTRLAGQMAAGRSRAEAQRRAAAAKGADRSRAASSGTDAGTEPVELAIAGYDEMSAPSILPALEDLSATELDDVLSYERAHRARATVINRIRQLQD